MPEIDKIQEQIQVHFDKQTDIGQFIQGDLGFMFKLLQQASKENNDKVLFETLLKKLPEDFFERERGKFLNKVIATTNSAFVAPILDENACELRWKIASLFEELLNNGTSHRIYIGSEQARMLLEDPLVKAMMDEQILHMNVYTSHVVLQSPMYVYFLRDYVKEFKSSMSIKERFQYYLWKKYNGYYVERYRWYREYLTYSYRYNLEYKDNNSYEIDAYPEVIDNDLKTNIQEYQSYRTHYAARPVLKSTVKGEIKDS